MKDRETQLAFIKARAEGKSHTLADIKAQLSILDAKRDMIYSLAREEEDPLDPAQAFSGYTSRTIRHEEKAGA